MIFYSFFILALFSAVGVIIAAHPVHSVLFLVLAFFNVAAILISIEADVLGLLFLVVYVGAIAVLFLFVVIILDLKRRSLSSAQFIPILPAVGVLSFVFFFEFFLILGRSSPRTSRLGQPNFNISWEFFNWFLFLDSFSPLEPLGQTLYSFYVLAFLLGGLVLLIALVGALILTLPSIGSNLVVKRQLITYQLGRRLDTTNSFFLPSFCFYSSIGKSICLRNRRLLVRVQLNALHLLLLGWDVAQW
jgi:NADH-quinone oxidoreductase subunit J